MPCDDGVFNAITDKKCSWGDVLKLGAAEVREHFEDIYSQLAGHPSHHSEQAAGAGGQKYLHPLDPKLMEDLKAKIIFNRLKESGGLSNDRFGGEPIHGEYSFRLKLPGVPYEKAVQLLDPKRLEELKASLDASGAIKENRGLPWANGLGAGLIHNGEYISRLKAQSPSFIDMLKKDRSKHSWAK